MHGLPVSLTATVSSFSQGEPVVGPIFEPHNSKAPLNGFSTAYSNAQATLEGDWRAIVASLGSIGRQLMMSGKAATGEEFCAFIEQVTADDLVRTLPALRPAANFTFHGERPQAYAQAQSSQGLHYQA